MLRATLGQGVALIFRGWKALARSNLALVKDIEHKRGWGHEEAGKGGGGGGGRVEVRSADRRKDWSMKLLNTAMTHLHSRLAGGVYTCIAGSQVACEGFEQ